jgi:hypothetical protein
MAEHIAPRRTSGTLNGVRVPHDVRDQIVEFVRHWSEAREIGAARLVRFCEDRSLTLAAPF